jgi:exodeoxyribonuclease V gamma subunit
MTKSRKTSILTGIESSKTGNWQGWEFDPLPNSDEILAKLLKMYWYGMTKPVHFFPQTSFEFAKLYDVHKNSDAAFKKAHDTWYGRDREHGESEDPYLKLCFQYSSDLFNKEFLQLADIVYTPILRNSREIVQ